MSKKAEALDQGNAGQDQGRTAPASQCDSRMAGKNPGGASGGRHPGPEGEASNVITDALKGASEAMGLGSRDSEGGTLGDGAQAHGALGRVVYRTSYGLSYGAVYPIALLARMIPKDNAVVHGLTDGALAARDAVYRPAPEGAESKEDVTMPAAAAQPG